MESVDFVRLQVTISQYLHVLITTISLVEILSPEAIQTDLILKLKASQIQNIYIMHNGRIQYTL